MRSRFSPSAIAPTPAPPTYSAKMRATNGCRDRVGFEPVEPLSVCGLAGVRVRTGVGKPVAVRRSTTEESPLVVRLGLHGGP